MNRNKKIFNYEDALSRIGNDEDIFKALLTTFLEVYPENLEIATEVSPLLNITAKEAIKNETVRKTAHKMKGACLTAGADLLGETTRGIEQIIKKSINNEKIDDVENPEQTLQELLDQLPRVYNDTQKEMRSYLKEHL